MTNNGKKAIKTRRYASRSRTGVFYTTKLWSPRKVSCNCPSWAYRRHCWHILQIKEKSA